MSDRRGFVLALGAAALAAPVACFAQSRPAAVARIGVLDPTSSAFAGDRADVLRKALREAGFVEGRNIVIDYRWAEGKYERLPAMAAELVASNVDLIVAVTPPAMQALWATASPIPIVMIAIPNPVGAGYVASLARPGGRVTGLSNLSVDLSGKYLELLRAAMPSLSRVAILVNPTHPNHPDMLQKSDASARINGVKVLPFEATTANEIESALAAMTRERVEALIVLPDAFYSNQRQQLAASAMKYRLPTMFWTRELVEAGGLMSYGQSNAEHFRLAATYVDKILNGARPSDLPVEQPTRVELILNRRTANAIGLPLPRDLLTRADLVIE